VCITQLPGKLNEVDDLNQLPLQLALASCQDSIANNLVKHGVDLNAVNTSGTCLLNFFIQSGKDKA
jgi:ankyrin repeat protein